MTDVKVSSYNIHSCVGADGLYSVDRVATVIREGDAQIVCLQEVEVNPAPMQTRIWSSRHGDDQPVAVASLAGGFHYHAFAPAIRSRALSRWKERHDFTSDRDVSGNFSDDRWKEKYNDDAAGNERSRTNARNDDMGKFGIAILSKYPIVEIKTHQYRRYKRKTLRNAMACLVSLPNNTLLWIVNIHLGCHFIRREQNQQAKELVSFIDSLEKYPKSCGVVVCGDLNSPPMFSTIRTIQNSGLVDMWQCCGGRGHNINGGTFPSDPKALGMPSSCCLRKLIRLDYIFLHESGNAKDIICKCIYVQDGGVGCSLASDHFPVCAGFFCWLNRSR